MARNFLTAVNLNKNELQNPQIHNLGTAPSSPVKGQLYMDTGTNILYFWDGTTWQSTKSGSATVYNQVLRDNGTAKTQRNAINFINSAPVNFALTDDVGGGETEVVATLNWTGSIIASSSFGQAPSAGAGTMAARWDHVHGTPTHLAADHSTIPISALAAPTANVSWGNFGILNLATPSNGTDAVNKSYVDNLVSGMNWKAAVRAATTTNGTLATAFANGQVIDGITLATGDRILIKNQTTQTENGIYTVNASGAPTRATDLDASAEFVAATVFVTTGTANADTGWNQITDSVVVGTSNIVWVQISSSGGSPPNTRQVIAGAGLTGGGALSADVTLNAVAADGSIVVAADSIAVGYAGSGGTNGTAVTAARSDHTHTGLVKRATQAVNAATSTAITHNFGTKDVLVQVYRVATPWDTVECDVERTDVNTVTVRFTTAPAASEYNVVIFG